jgi:hypothetical protein
MPSAWWSLMDLREKQFIIVVYPLVKMALNAF